MFFSCQHNIIPKHVTYWGPIGDGGLLFVMFGAVTCNLCLGSLSFLLFTVELYHRWSLLSFFCSGQMLISH